MEKVIRYKCDYCGELFGSEEWCLEHEKAHKRSEKANEMLDEGKTLEGINNECHLWPEVPKHLKNVTKDNCFVIKCPDGQYAFYLYGKYITTFPNKEHCIIGITTYKNIHEARKHEKIISEK